MNSSKNTLTNSGINRRQFSKSLGLIGAGLFVSAKAAQAAGPTHAPDYFEIQDDESAQANKDVPVIKHWKRFELDREYRGSWIVAADLDGDGQAEIISARNGGSLSAAERGKYGFYICSVVAHRLDGSVLWKWGNAKKGRNYLGYDVACQVYDWDGDGKPEVVILAKEALVVLDGATGKEKRRFSTPTGATDCIVFCNLSGKNRATDVLIKNRYDQIWAFNYDGKLLWTSKQPGGYQTAHQPRPMDIDGDGKDEIMAGYALLNPDGTTRWTLQKKGGGRFGGHLDCARFYPSPTNPDDARIILTFCGGNRMAKVDGNGLFSWSLTGKHYESIDIAKVRPDIAGKQIIVDIPYASWGQKPIRIIDENGIILGQFMVSESRYHRIVDWTGDGISSIVVGQPRAMYDGWGKKVGIFDIPIPNFDMPASERPSGGHIEILPTLADMTGDGVPDLIFSTNPGSVIYIYKNEKGKKPEGGFPLGTEMNYTLY